MTDLSGREHAVLSDGRHHVRLDLDEGSLSGAGPVMLHYHLHGLASVGPRLMSLRRLLHLCRHGRFSPKLFPPDPRMGRWLTTVRVLDALACGASQREIAIALYGAERVGPVWKHDANSLRLSVRRLAREARGLADGGWRALLRQRR